MTGADSGFARLAEGLLRSLREAEPALGASLRIHVLDFGLGDAGRAQLAPLADIVPVEPPMPMIGPPEKRSFFLSRMCKAYLVDLVPGFQAYMWMDADIWLQTPRALADVVRPLRSQEFVAVPELDRAYRVLFEPGTRQNAVRARRLTRGFGARAAALLHRLPNVNSGLVAARAEAKMWGAWRERMRQVFAVEGDLDFVSDQAGLNAAIFLDKVPFYPLQSTLNWCFGGGVPRLDDDARFVTPLSPHQVIGLCHLTGVGIKRPVPIKWTRGGSVDLACDYLSVQAWRATNPRRRDGTSRIPAHTPS